MFFIYFLIACVGYCGQEDMLPQEASNEVRLDYLTYQEKACVVAYLNQRVRGLQFSPEDASDVNMKLSNRTHHLMKFIMTRLTLDEYNLKEQEDREEVTLSNIYHSDGTILCVQKKGRPYSHAIPLGVNLGEDLRKIIQKIAVKRDVASNVLRLVLYYFSGDFNAIPQGSRGICKRGSQFPMYLDEADNRKKKFQRVFKRGDLCDAFPKASGSFHVPGLSYIHII